MQEQTKINEKSRYTLKNDDNDVSTDLQAVLS